MTFHLFVTRFSTLFVAIVFFSCEDDAFAQYLRRNGSRTQYVETSSTASSDSKANNQKAADFDAAINKLDDFGDAPIPDLTEPKRDAGVTKVDGMFERFVTFDPNVDVLWPGCIVSGDDFTKGFLAPKGWALRPLQVTLTGLIDTAPRSWSFVMDRPSLAQFTAGVQKIVESKTATKPEFSTTARISFDRVNFDSLSQALMRLGIHASFLGASVRSSLQTEEYHKRSNVAVEVTQNYYTASVEYPGFASRFLTESELERVIKSSQLQQVTSDSKASTQVAAGSKTQRKKVPAYVASVTFGRKLIFIASSSEDQTKLSLAVEAAASFIIGGGGVSLTTEQKEALKNANLRIIVLGGPSPAFMTLLQQDPNKSINEFLNAGISFWGQSGGLPLSYVLRSVKDGKIVRMKMAAEFTEPDKTAAQFDEMTLRFHTTSENKDRETGVGVKIFADQTLIGLIDSNTGETEDWDENTDHDVAMVAVKTPKLSKSATYTMVISLSGKAQTWKFTVKGTGKFGGKTWSFPPLGEFLMGENEPHTITLTLPNPK
jgi:hypothetical protein